MIALLVVGFACACVTGKPAQAPGQVLQSLPPLIEMWEVLASVAGFAVFFVTTSLGTRGRASPAVLQRFLF